MTMIFPEQFLSSSSGTLATNNAIVCFTVNLIYTKKRRQIDTSSSVVFLFAAGAHLLACVTESMVGCDVCMCEDIVKSSPSPSVDAAAAGRGMAIPSQLLATARPEMSSKLD
jgi:hypothetical protein